jgi:Ca2+-binding EF-hand superfamily protein
MRFLDPLKSLMFAHAWIEPALDKYPEFSQAELLTFAEIFRIVDEDSSGRISVPELVEVFRIHGTYLKTVTQHNSCYKIMSHRFQLFLLFTRYTTTGQEIDREGAIEMFVRIGADAESEMSWMEYLDLMRFLNPQKVTTVCSKL